MPIIIALEGGDGTGKSTVAQHLVEISSAVGLSCSVVGRYAENSTELIGRITDLLQYSGKLLSEDQLVFQADIYMRVAREFQRTAIAINMKSDVVLMDRFVLSVISRAAINGLELSPIRNVLKSVVSMANLYATLLCKCPFEIAWKRVVERTNRGDKNLSAKEMMGEQYNRRLFTTIGDEFDRGELTSSRWEIDTSGSHQHSFELVQGIFEQVAAKLKA